MMFDRDDPRAVDATKDDGDPRDWSKASRAVIAFDGHSGLVLWHVGAHVETMIEAVGRGSNTEDLGFESDPASAGVFVWEGKTTGGRKNWHSGDYEDCYLTGTYRSPNDAEWAAIQMHKNPWNEADWLREPEHQCTDCGTIGMHHCQGVPGGFSDDKKAPSLGDHFDCMGCSVCMPDTPDI